MTDVCVYAGNCFKKCKVQMETEDFQHLFYFLMIGEI